ncbi:hypothetical protein BPAE_0127g00170 [Botrytis paeoniae]|uniref:Uncharacterized protein n=1 Tax=Botrytis paeoniae TaxID=278948 RepID=A0A4Z1FPH0_9HELO|nr:hypothetical protein BPAE_0127g00170 [Botrytis paeoniae]
MTTSFSTYLYHAFDDRVPPTVPFGMAVIAIISDEYILWHRTHMNISDRTVVNSSKKAIDVYQTRDNLTKFRWSQLSPQE